MNWIDTGKQQKTVFSPLNREFGAFQHQLRRFFPSFGREVARNVTCPQDQSSGWKRSTCPLLLRPCHDPHQERQPARFHSPHPRRVCGYGGPRASPALGPASSVLRPPYSVLGPPSSVLRRAAGSNHVLGSRAGKVNLLLPLRMLQLGALLLPLLPLLLCSCSCSSSAPAPPLRPPKRQAGTTRDSKVCVKSSWYGSSFMPEK